MDSELDSLEPEIKSLEYTKSVAELAKILEVGPRTIFKLVDNNDAPQKTEHGYSIKEWLNYLVKHDYINTNEKAVGSKQDLEKEKIRVQTAILTLQLDKEKEKLIERTQHEAIVSSIASLTIDAVRLISKRLDAKFKDEAIHNEAIKLEADIITTIRDRIAEMDDI